MRLAAAIAATALCTACAGGLGLTRKEKLLEEVRDYNDGVRWGRFDRAVAHLPAERRERFVERHQRVAEDLDIADYEIVRIDLDKPDEARVRVDVSWSLKSRGLLQRTVVEQEWRQGRGGWEMVGETRLAGAPLTLYDERPRADAAK